MTQKASDSLIQRLLVGSLAIVLFLLIDYYAMTPGFQWFFLSVLTLIVGMALWEYYEMLVAMQYRPMMRTGIWSAALYLAACLLQILLPAYPFLPALALFLFFVAAFFLQLVSNGKDPIAGLAVTFFGFAYIVMPLSLLLYITYYPFAGASQDGRWWLLYLALVTKMTDIGGFAMGKLFGSHPLAPHISPNKTIEGAVGGIFFAFIASIGVGFYLLNLTLSHTICLGGALSIAALFGDLAESLLKRNAGFKDSSRLPGLGGLLDIMDSMIFTAPVLYLYLSFVAVK